MNNDRKLMHGSRLIPETQKYMPRVSGSMCTLQTNLHEKSGLPLQMIMSKANVVFKELPRGDDDQLSPKKRRHNLSTKESIHF